MLSLCGQSGGSGVVVVLMVGTCRETSQKVVLKIDRLNRDEKKNPSDCRSGVVRA
jgi:hypothetical protein